MKKKVAVFSNGWSTEYLRLVLEGMKKRAQAGNVDLYAFINYSAGAEDKIEVEKKEFDEISKMFNIEYATITKKAIQNESSFMIKGHGNDIIGRTNTF